MKSSTARLLFSASTLIGIPQVYGLTDEVFAAIDKNNDGLREVNRKASQPSNQM